MTPAERISSHRRGDYSAGRDAFRSSLIRLFEQSLAFQPRMSGSDWAERFGWIPKSTGAESGPVTLYGYQRGLMDAMCDPRIPLVTVLKAARVGYTRCATLAIGYHLHHDSTLCAVALPTVTDAEDFGGSEVAPMLRETPVLAEMLRSVRRGERQDKATFYQLTNGASVRIVGAAADDAFRRYSARFMFADEVDAEGWTPGPKSQGDKLELMWTRGETFWNRKQVRGSTPLLDETSRIARLWEESDQRRYFVPCPHCGEMQYLQWGGPDVQFGIKWALKEDRTLDSVWYVGVCGCVIGEDHKAWMDARGEWRATAVPKTPGHAGFHLWTGMSLHVNAAWPVIVQQWLSALEDPATRVQPFVNLRLGRTYRVTYGQEIKAGKFLDRLEEYPAEVPAEVSFLTLGGDTQSGDLDPRIEASVYGWGRGLECWLIGHFVLKGDPSEATVWADLDALLKRKFVREDGAAMTIKAAAIDSGGHHTAETYAFCNERRRLRVWAIKGRSEMAGRRGKVWPRKPSSKLGQVWHMISGNAARDWAYGSLGVEEPGPRYVHFPEKPAAGSREIDEEFFTQLTRERLAVHRLGYTEWRKPKGSHEAGVCFVYAYAAVCGLQAMSGRFVAVGMPLSEAPPVPETARGVSSSLPAGASSKPLGESARNSVAPVPIQAPVAPHPARHGGGFLQRQRGWLSRR
jgi:phage terminase large subunit GpA-like protein